jgi:large subunit ribosomal protein L10
MARPEKVAAVADLSERFRSSNAGVLTEYRGLTVAQLKELRRALGEHASYAVVKNTLTAIAAKEAGVDAFDGQLTGPTAIAFVTGDPVEAAKGLRDFARAHPQLVIKAGYLEGRALDATEIGRLADLESREVLLARTAGALKASLNNAAYLFAAPLSQAARAVDALRVKREAEAPAGQPETALEDGTSQTPAPAEGTTQG